MNARTSVSSALEPSTPENYAFARPHLDLPSGRQALQNCAGDASTCLSAVPIMTGEHRATMLAINGNIRSDVCVVVDPPLQGTPELTGVHLRTERFVDEVSSNDAMPFEYFAIVTQKNVIHSMKNMPSSSSAFLPVCFGGISTAFEGNGLGSGTVCLHHEALWERFVAELRVVEEDCESALMAIAHKVPHRDWLETIHILASGDGVSHAPSSSEWPLNVPTKFATINPSPVEVSVAAPASNEGSDMEDAPFLIIRMHEGGEGDIFSVTHVVEGQEQVLMIDGGSGPDFLDAALEALDIGEGSLKLKQFVLTSALTANGFGILDERDYLDSEEFLFSPKLAAALERSAGADAVDFRLNSMWNDGIKVLESYTSARSGDDVTVTVVDPLADAALIQDAINSLFMRSCDGSTRIGKRYLEPEQGLFAQELNEFVEISEGQFENGKFRVANDTAFFQIISPSANEYYCVGLPDLVNGDYGLLYKWRQFLSSEGKTTWASVGSDLSSLIYSFRDIAVDSDKYRAIGSTSEWVPSILEDDKPYEYKGNPIEGDTVSYMSIAAYIYGQSDDDEPLGLFSGASMAKSIVRPEWREEAGGTDNITRLLFMTVPNHGTLENSAPDLYSTFWASYYLFSGGASRYGAPSYEVLKMIVDSRRPLLDSARGCINNDSDEDDFVIVLQHNQVYPDFTGDEKGECNILHTLMYKCPMDSIADWQYDEAKMKLCRYSPACRKYGLGFVAEVPPGEIDDDFDDFEFVSIALTAASEEELDDTANAELSVSSGGSLIDCNAAREEAFGKIVGCSLHWAYDSIEYENVDDECEGAEEEQKGSVRDDSVRRNLEGKLERDALLADSERRRRQEELDRVVARIEEERAEDEFVDRRNVQKVQEMVEFWEGLDNVGDDGDFVPPEPLEPSGDGGTSVKERVQFWERLIEHEKFGEGERPERFDVSENPYIEELERTREGGTASDLMERVLPRSSLDSEQRVQEALGRPRSSTLVSRVEEAADVGRGHNDEVVGRERSDAVVDEVQTRSRAGAVTERPEKKKVGTAYGVDVDDPDRERHTLLQKHREGRPAIASTLRESRQMWQGGADRSTQRGSALSPLLRLVNDGGSDEGAGDDDDDGGADGDGAEDAPPEESPESAPQAKVRTQRAERGTIGPRLSAFDVGELRLRHEQRMGRLGNVDAFLTDVFPDNEAALVAMRSHLLRTARDSAARHHPPPPPPADE
eukprot:TRINITY_DN3177_c0_g1_i11.p1 TRINITY_DN3177_c0_g1~~TRINITY_DN3177_c0_g1_i11.p1  ORF type:complete len:1220 (+),score=353.13 TRINITY_DN3177_c0_g1_i11:935-4594(+)